MSTPRIPQYLTDLHKWMVKSAASSIRAVKSQVKVFRESSRNVIMPERMEKLIRKDARKHEAFENAVRTGYRAKIERVRLGKGKNTLIGIRFEAA